MTVLTSGLMGFQSLQRAPVDPDVFTYQNSVWALNSHAKSVSFEEAPLIFPTRITYHV